MDGTSLDIITKALEQTAKIVEEEVDAKLSKLNELEEDDFERLKEKRLEALKKAQKHKQVCMKRGCLCCIFEFNFNSFSGCFKLICGTRRKMRLLVDM